MKHRYFLEKFDGGLLTNNTQSDDDNMTVSPNLLNVEFNDDSAVSTKKGYTYFDSMPPGTTLYGMQSYVQSGNLSLLAITDLGLNKYSNGTWTTIPDGTFSISDTNPTITMMQFQNKMFISDGINTPLKYNNNVISTWGPVATIDGPVATVTGVGLLTGYYNWRIAAIDEDGSIFNMGSLSNGLHVNSGTVTLTSIPVYADSNSVLQKAICRNKADVSGLYYIIGTIDNSVQEFTDNIADLDNINMVDFAPINANPPLKWTVFVHHLGYIFAASLTSDHPDYLYYSQINEPSVYDYTDIFRIGEGDGYSIRALEVFTDSIMIFTADNFGNGNVYLLYTPSANNADWSLTKLDITNSTSAKLGIAKYSKYINWVNQNMIQDMYEKGQGELFPSTISYNIAPEFNDITKSSVHKSVAIDYNNKLWFCVPTSGSQQNNTLYQFDYLRGKNTKTREYGAWSKFTDQYFSNLIIYSGELLGYIPDSNNIYRLNTGYNNAGQSYYSFYETPYIYGNEAHENNNKRWRQIYLSVDDVGEWNFLLEWRDPSKPWSMDNSQSIKLNPTLNLTHTEYIPINLNSKAIQLRFSNANINKYFKVNDVELHYNLRSVY